MKKLPLFALFFIVLFCFLGPLFSIYAINQTNLSISNLSFSLAHPLGTDRVGRDILTQLMYGGRVSMIVGIVTAFIGSGLGLIMGVMAGYFGGKVSKLIMSIIDVVLCIPLLGVVLLLGAVAFEIKLGDNLKFIILILTLAFFMWPNFARIVRSRVIVITKADYVTAAKLMGVSHSKIILRHIIPNVLPYVFSGWALMVGDAILSESALSFLGIGVGSVYPTWGNMISADNYIFSNYPLMWVPAGVMLSLTIICVNSLGGRRYELT